jgi:hypothetical protein
VQLAVSQVTARPRSLIYVGYSKKKTGLFNRYKARVPKSVGEYAINVSDQTRDFFTPVKPMIL